MGSTLIGLFFTLQLTSWSLVLAEPGCTANYDRYLLTHMGNMENQVRTTTLTVTTETRTHIVVESAYSADSVTAEVASSLSLPLTTPDRHDQSGTSKTAQGLWLESRGSSDVTVYASDCEESSCEVYLALPVSSLGRRYYPVTYWPPYWGAVIYITAYRDDTTVALTFQSRRGLSIAYNGVTYEGNGVLEETLNAFDTLLIQTPGDLSGTLITASQPVAVFSGNKGAVVESEGDLFGSLIVQIPPVESWGQTFLVVFPEGRPQSIVKVVAANPATRVRVRHEGESRGLRWQSRRPGDFHQFAIAERFLSVQSSGPILLVQILPSGTVAGSEDSPQPSMSLVPSLEQYKSHYVFTTPQKDVSGNLSRHYLLITTPASGIDTLLLDSSRLDGATWREIPGMASWVGAVYPVDPGTHTLVQSQHGLTVGAVLYGSDHEAECTYSLPVGLCLNVTNFDDTLQTTLASSVAPSTVRPREGITATTPPTATPTTIPPKTTPPTATPPPTPTPRAAITPKAIPTTPTLATKTTTTSESGLPPCQHKWTTLSNTRSQGGRPRPGASTEAACRLQCEGRAQCVGAETQPDGAVYCWLYGDRNGMISNLKPMPGAELHVLTRCPAGGDGNENSSGSDPRKGDSADDCECPTLYVAAPTELRELNGFYGLHQCQVAGRDVFVQVSGSMYLYYHQPTSRWVFSPDLLSPAQNGVQGEEMSQKHPSGAYWVMYSGDTQRPLWEINVECACQVVPCGRLNITSDDVNNALRGEFVHFTKHSMNDRPVYQNKAEGLFLYFHVTADCSFWGVTPKLPSDGNWVVYVHDIAPQPTSVRGLAKVARSSGWIDDVTMRFECLDEAEARGDE